MIAACGGPNMTDLDYMISGGIVIAGFVGLFAWIVVSWWYDDGE